MKTHGSQEKAFQAIQDAANSALKSGQLKPNSKGILPGGDEGPIIDVGGTSVRLIGGRIVDEAVKIGSVSRKGL